VLAAAAFRLCTFHARWRPLLLYSLLRQAVRGIGIALWLLRLATRTTTHSVAVFYLVFSSAFLQTVLFGSKMMT
jgi:hypothetical protein